MKIERSCEEIQRLIFDRRRGDLSELTRQEIEQHLESCQLCREQAKKTDQMFDSISAHSSQKWSDSKKDEIFEGIRAEIESKKEADVVGLNRTMSRTGMVRQISVIAASVLIGVFGVIFYQNLVDSNFFVRSNQPSAASVASEKADEHERRDALAKIKEVDDDNLDGVEVYHSADAKWTSENQQDSGKIRLTRGELLIEVSPAQISDFRVETPHQIIRVTGTIFYVRVRENKTETGVAAGSVSIESKVGNVRVELPAGREYDGQKVETVPAVTRQNIERRVDIDTHRSNSARMKSRRLATRLRKSISKKVADWEPVVSKGAPDRLIDESNRGDRAARLDSPPRRAKSRKKQPSRPASSSPQKQAGVANSELKNKSGSPTIQQLRRNAIEARHKGNSNLAVDFLEQALNKSSPGEPARADILLSLGRLHLNQLGAPRRTEHYFDQFLQKFPDDSAYEAVRQRLCDITNRPDLRREYNCSEKN